VIVDYLAEENYGVAFRKGSDICAEVNKISTIFWRTVQWLHWLKNTDWSWLNN